MQKKYEYSSWFEPNNKSAATMFCPQEWERNGLKAGQICLQFENQHKCTIKINKENIFKSLIISKGNRSLVKK